MTRTALGMLAVLAAANAGCIHGGLAAYDWTGAGLWPAPANPSGCRPASTDEAAPRPAAADENNGWPATPEPAAPRPDISFVQWLDPVEGAFRIDVPRGWRVQGGLRRNSALDYRNTVRVTSPDGRITVFLMDPEIPTFTPPDPVLSFAGMREGSYQTYLDGTRVLVRRYTTGVRFAEDYATARLGHGLADLRIERSRPRPDRAAAVREHLAPLEAAAMGMLCHEATVGEVFFTGQRDGRPYRGYVSATTVLTEIQMGGGLWQVSELVGLVAPPERVAEAEAVLQRMVASFALDPQWLRGQNELQARINEISREHNREMAAIISGRHAGATRPPARSRDRFGEYIRGTVLVRDPYGREFEIPHTHNYYWIDALDDIVGTDYPTNPDPLRYRELQIVP